MLRSLNEIKNYTLQAADGEIGKCKDFLFDDNLWIVRFMIADTGKWIFGRDVLISPISLGEPNWESKLFPVKLTKEKIKNAPGVEKAKPVSRQLEIDFYKYFRWPYYWEGGYGWGPAEDPRLLFDKSMIDDKESEFAKGDSNLRSIDEVTNYYISTNDGELGHVDDFIIDDKNWKLHYMIIDTRNWLPGKKVLISPDWITKIDWTKRMVSVQQNKDEIKNSPEFDPSKPVNREYETILYDFYGRPKYW